MPNAKCLVPFFFQQIGSALAGAIEHHSRSPGVDGLVVAAEQNFGDGSAFPHPRPGVMRAIQQALPGWAALGEGVLGCGLVMSQHAPQEPNHGIDEHHRGKFAA